MRQSQNLKISDTSYGDLEFIFEYKSELKDYVFENCRFKDLTLSCLTFSNVQFIDCTFENVNIDASVFNRCAFIVKPKEDMDSSSYNSEFNRFDISCTEFKECLFFGGQFESGCFERNQFTSCVFDAVCFGDPDEKSVEKLSDVLAPIFNNAEHFDKNGKMLAGLEDTILVKFQEYEASKRRRYFNDTYMKLSFKHSLFKAALFRNCYIFATDFRFFDFYECCFDDSKIENSSFSGHHGNKQGFHESLFLKTDFLNTFLSKTLISDSEFQNVRFHFFNNVSGTVSNTSFSRVVFDHFDLFGHGLSKSGFSHCLFIGLCRSFERFEGPNLDFGWFVDSNMWSETSKNIGLIFQTWAAHYWLHSKNGMIPKFFAECDNKIGKWLYKHLKIGLPKNSPILRNDFPTRFVSDLLNEFKSSVEEKDENLKFD